VLIVAILNVINVASADRISAPGLYVDAKVAEQGEGNVRGMSGIMIARDLLQIIRLGDFIHSWGNKHRTSPIENNIHILN